MNKYLLLVALCAPFIQAQSEEKAKKCSKNEKWYDCIPCSAQTCIEYVNCALEKKCNPGCGCIEGFRRNNKGICVPEKECQQECTLPNEEWNPYALLNQSCTATLKDNPRTVAGCSCKSGYFRNEKGVCIPEEQCATCGQNERFYNCGLCGDSCEDVNCLMCTQPGCYCSRGFKRINGTCVPESQCKKTPHDLIGPITILPFPFCHKQYEQFYICKPCNTNCHPFSNICNKRCTPGCDCIRGYRKNINGDCVPSAFCNINKTCSGLNEGYGCTPCVPTCLSDPDTVCTMDCRLDCVCNPGYIRNRNNICIPKENCGANELCTERNEEYKKCAPLQEPTCFEDVKNNTAVSKCKPGCTCKPGYVRHQGHCIPKTECPVQCYGSNEVPSTCQKCDESCIKPQSDDFISICLAICISGCNCIDGYCRNTRGQCVPPYKCPANEEHVECVPCKAAEQCHSKEPVICPFICKPGCACMLGYKRNSQGVCVPEQQC